MNSLVLEFKNVSFDYDRESRELIHSLDFKVEKGQFISILGPSGCGKSTLFRLITGLEQPTSGEILINGTSYTDRSGLTGYMPQQDLLMPWRTVLENAALPLELRGIKKSEAHQIVVEQLEGFGLAGVEHQFPHRLSGGMKQRVSFLRAVLSGSDLLLLDEPFSALDAITKIMMQEWLLEQWRQREHTILFITHDVDEALFLSDRIFVYSDSPVHRFEETDVPMGRPRSLKDMNDPKILNMKVDLINRLRTKVVI